MSVIDYYGYWPTFHDATIRRVKIDGETKALIIAFILNEDIDQKKNIAPIIIKWHKVEKFSLAADYRCSD